MSIKGNLVGNVSPRTNWNQTDTARADYLVGREVIVESIADAKAAGTKAQTAAENAEKNAKDYAYSVSQTTSTNANAYTDSKHKTFTATVSSSGWSSSAPYTQTVSVSGILSSDTPHIHPVYSSTLETALAQKEAWQMVNKATAITDAITFTCFEDKPATNIPVQIEVNR